MSDAMSDVMHAPMLAPPLALRFPLKGSRLIEASAGTGKTFTIAMLYVRLVLGHGGERAFPGGRLTPPQILVVTFTDAATRELRDRIRARLAEAAACFRADPLDGAIDGAKPSTADPVLLALRDDYAPEAWSACARALELAADWMDEAAISTIHAWCHRMLREHAFDSQTPLTQTLETDLSEVYAEAVRDYWRSFYYPLSATDLRTVAAYWAQPSALERAILPLGAWVASDEPVPPPVQTLATVRAARRQGLLALKAPWTAWVEELLAWYAQARAQKWVDGSSLRTFPQWCKTLREWAVTDDNDDEPPLTDTAWSRLTPEGMAEVWKGEGRPEHPAFAALVRLRDELAALPTAERPLLKHAVGWVHARFEAAKRQRAQIGFDDLLVRLESALNGPSGQRLADIVRQQFPVALIDEFQDTDPRQYQLFDRIYQVRHNDERTALILIGDPKQAIYAFRGADIFTYLQAREAVGDRLYSLETNYRSTQAMVDAVNHCFGYAEANVAGAGTFMFRTAGQNPVPFSAVRARGRAEVLQVDGEAPAALHLAVADEKLVVGVGHYRSLMAESAATQIVAWLNRAGQGRAGFVRPETGMVPLRPGDMAVLVNNRYEAAAIRQALGRRRVRTVYLSDKDSVYATPQAVELQCWLHACAAPDDERLLRAALATPTLGLTLAELDALRQDEEAWELRVLQFKAYAELWRRDGVLPLLRRLLLDFRCADRLLAGDGHEGSGGDSGWQSGERVLTDVLHLAELLQTVSASLDGEHALLRYLAEQIAQPDGGADERRMRLESDDALVKVVTIHKSKGLEYPLVFLPFICAARCIEAGRQVATWHDASGKRHLDVQLTPDQAALADRERLAEDVRKLYVALTRARHFTWVGMAQVKGSERNAVNHVLGVGAGDAPTWRSALEAFAQGQSSITLELHPASSIDTWRDPGTDAQGGDARTYGRTETDRWRIHSYSSLSHVSSAGGEQDAFDETARTERLQAVLNEAALDDDEMPRPPTRGVGVHRFPKGAEAGTLLHEVLEKAARMPFAEALQTPGWLDEASVRACASRGWAPLATQVAAWTRQCVETPLPLPGIQPVALVDAEYCRPELEFWFEAENVDLAAVDAALSRHVCRAQQRPHLEPIQVHGMLRGFIDVVIEHGGQYFIVDYKSNWLGASDDAYTLAAMEQAVLAHRYDLQAALYVLALHRLLKSRLPDYDYEQHVGGVGYLFLRGIAAPTRGLWAQRPDRALIETLDGLFAGVHAGRQEARV